MTNRGVTERVSSSQLCPWSPKSNTPGDGKFTDFPSPQSRLRADWATSWGSTYTSLYAMQKIYGVPVLQTAECNKVLRETFPHLTLPVLQSGKKSNNVDQGRFSQSIFRGRFPHSHLLFYTPCLYSAKWKILWYL